MICRSKKQKGETVLRLLIAILEEKKALEVRLRLYGMDEHWDVRVAENGLQAAALLEMERWDVLLLDSRLRADGTSLWEKLCAAPPLCPPRVLALWQDGPRPAADVALPADCGGARLAAFRARQKAAALSGSGSPCPDTAGGRAFSGRAGNAPGMEGTALCGVVPVPPGPRPRTGSAARQPAVRGVRPRLRRQRRGGGALPPGGRGGRVHHGQHSRDRAFLRRDHRPGQGQAHQPGLSDGGRLPASLTP